MSILTEYFVATSDDEASDVLLRPAGPAGGPSARSARSGVLRRLGRVPSRRFPDRISVVVDGGGIEPVLQMLLLEAILTGRSEEDIEDGRTGGAFIAGSETDGPSIVKLSHELTAALSRASTSDLVDAAESWATADEFDGATDPGTLAAFLHRLADLARSAASTDAGLYCWVSP